MVGAGIFALLGEAALLAGSDTYLAFLLSVSLRLCRDIPMRGCIRYPNWAVFGLFRSCLRSRALSARCR